MIIFTWLLIVFVIFSVVSAFTGIRDAPKWKYHDYENWPKIKGEVKSDTTYLSYPEE